MARAAGDLRHHARIARTIHNPTHGTERWRPASAGSRSVGAESSVGASYYYYTARVQNASERDADASAGLTFVHYIISPREPRRAGRRSLVVRGAVSGASGAGASAVPVLFILCVRVTVTIMSDRDRSSPSLTDTPLKTYIGRHDDDYPLINGNDFLCHGASFNKKYGKSVNNKDALEDKKDDSDLWETQAAFLGPNLWDKTLPYDPDLKYVDLDEFLSENGMPGEGLAGAHLGAGGASFPPLGLPAPVTKRERSPSPSDCMSPDTINPPLSPADSTFSMASSGRDFDPRTRAFSDEELKPQPMIKKSRKQFVPDDLKDDKYWARRRKNNMAAKRSRDARRMKENQIALRAGYLEKENMGLRQEVELLKKENHILREKLSKFADV